MVVVGKGGEAAPLVALALELMTAVLALSDDNYEDVIPRLQEAGRKLGDICQDRTNAYLALTVVASKVDPEPTMTE
jgi:hypothetical protein